MPINDASTEDLLKDADTLREAGNLRAAIAAYEEAIALGPANVYARYWVATCLEQLGELETARRHCDAGLAVEERSVALLARKGSIAVAADDQLLGLRCYEQVGQLAPDFPGVDALIADRLCLIGESERALARFDRALALDPSSTTLQSNRLFVLNYAETLRPEEKFELHKAWGRRYETELADQRRPHSNSRDTQRVLRIGYVSGDLREHAVGTFVEPLLANHDRNRFAVYCYATYPGADDHVARRLQGYGATWCRAATLDDAGLAAAIRADAIDILVDLSGHTVHNRLLALARKPAPVQATWLGYLSTTGLSTIDYRITDSFLDPPGLTEHLHTERLFRLPHAACYLPPPEAPSIGELPALRNGYATFGSLNQWSKVNARVRETWIELLRALPESRLLAIAPGARNPELVAALTEPFVRAGIEARRLQFVPPASLGEFLRTVASVDVALDPFPYGGGTTTLQCLWMGVPVVTLAGATSVARNAVGPLSTVGLGELVTPDRASYVAAAARLGGATATLRELRAGLRDHVRSGPLADAPAFARNLEDAYRQMWLSYCEAVPR